MADPRRVSTSLGYAVTQGGPRVSTAAAYAVVGEAVAPTLPTPATVAAAATGPGELTATRPVAATGADSVALYMADTADDLPEEGPEAGATLLSTDDEWPPEVVGGLGFETTRYFAEYATNAEGTVRSNVAIATTLGPDLPCRPGIDATALSGTVARLTFTACEGE